MTTTSHMACVCGQHHVLGEFGVRTKVLFAERKGRHANVLVHEGEIGVVTEWSHYGGPLYYRVEFPDGQRDNFNPCELRKADGPKRFFELDDDGEVQYFVVALDLEHAKIIIRRHGVEFGYPSQPLDKATGIEWRELTAERASAMKKCHTEDKRGVITLADANLGDWFCTEW
jgi:hypothetical protein